MKGLASANVLAVAGLSGSPSRPVRRGLWVFSVCGVKHQILSLHGSGASCRNMAVKRGEQGFQTEDQLLVPVTVGDSCTSWFFGVKCVC